MKAISDVKSNKGLEIIENGQCADSRFMHLIKHNGKCVGNFVIWYECDPGPEMAIDKVCLLPSHSDEKFIESLVDAMCRFRYYARSCMKSFVVRCDRIGFMSTDDSERDNQCIPKSEYDRIKKTFIDKILSNKRYICFPLFDPDNIPHIIMYKPMKHRIIGENQCEIILSFDESNEILFHHGRKNEIGEYQNDNKIFACTRRFHVVKKKIRNKFNMIKIVFDLPLVFCCETLSGDVGMNFIANGTNYTPGDYRLNELWSDLSYPSVMGSYRKLSYIYAIDGFSYFETKADSMKSGNGECKHPNLCRMVRNIYADTD